MINHNVDFVMADNLPCKANGCGSSPTLYSAGKLDK